MSLIFKLRAGFLSSGQCHWMRWIRDTCPILDTVAYPTHLIVLVIGQKLHLNLNIMSDIGHWSEVKSLNYYNSDGIKVKPVLIKYYSEVEFGIMNWPIRSAHSIVKLLHLSIYNYPFRRRITKIMHKLHVTLIFKRRQ